MGPLECAVIGTGWCGGIRAETLSKSALCKKLHVCEIRPDRLAEIKALTNPATATLTSTDGIVPYWSSHLDGAQSELIVPSNHSAHQNPQAIAEVRRILKLHASRN